MATSSTSAMLPERGDGSGAATGSRDRSWSVSAVISRWFGLSAENQRAVGLVGSSLPESDPQTQGQQGQKVR
ncbi:hypothetical protein GCM10010987_22250 [Bradyrhizobium guangdongense]|uniref:Uncharacterized protein n=1 Tax=Bradyrhizobium guangdongense TaxID=1325090 RepID=A0AA87W2D8_9BRAD|nr:hypothetical protein GCM10010987_22250 [Bradyrhizobium guangdongense]